MPASPRRRHESPWFTPERLLVIELGAITVGVFYLCYLLVEPFVPALAWALTIAVVAYPMHAAILRRLKRKSLAAALTVLAVTVMILVPAILVVNYATSDAVAGADNLKKAWSDGQWRDKLEQHPLTARAAEWIEQRVNVRGQVEQAAGKVLEYTGRAFTISVQLVTGLLITLFLLFYFLRDRDIMLSALRDAIPLSPRESERVFRKVGDTLLALTYGTLLLALLQGTLGGVMFMLLGLPAPVLWGAVMAVLAILPVFGAAIVWIPAALYLFLIEGSWEKALILTVWGGIVVGLIDNLLYPQFVKSRLRIHTVPVFIAVLGGLVAFGASGMVVGPVALAIAVALAGIWQHRMNQSDAVENSADAAKAADNGAATSGKKS